jgi:hypothetical protein
MMQSLSIGHAAARLPGFAGRLKPVDPGAGADLPGLASPLMVEQMGILSGGPAVFSPHPDNPFNRHATTCVRPRQRRILFLIAGLWLSLSVKRLADGVAHRKGECMIRIEINGCAIGP